MEYLSLSPLTPHGWCSSPSILPGSASSHTNLYFATNSSIPNSPPYPSNPLNLSYESFVIVDLVTLHTHEHLVTPRVGQVRDNSDRITVLTCVHQRFALGMFGILLASCFLEMQVVAKHGDSPGLQISP